jgi:hypothetical protein
LPRFDHPIEPMTLRNMRELGVRLFHSVVLGLHMVRAMLSSSAMSLFSTAFEGAPAVSPGIARPHRAISRSGRALFVR